LGKHSSPGNVRGQPPRLQKRIASSSPLRFVQGRAARLGRNDNTRGAALESLLYAKACHFELRPFATANGRSGETCGMPLTTAQADFSRNGIAVTSKRLRCGQNFLHFLNLHRANPDTPFNKRIL
jgi:hypothetical protein